MKQLLELQQQKVRCAEINAGFAGSARCFSNGVILGKSSGLECHSKWVITKPRMHNLENLGVRCILK